MSELIKSIFDDYDRKYAVSSDSPDVYRAHRNAYTCGVLKSMVEQRDNEIQRLTREIEELKACLQAS